MRQLARGTGKPQVNDYQESGENREDANDGKPSRPKPFTT